MHGCGQPTYSIFNIQQYFGTVNILETFYFNLYFISLAASNVPNELSKIVKPSDFYWKLPILSIGVLGLMAKNVKLKNIDRLQISSFTSRGIKSALNDPIKTVQKTINKIYSQIEHAFSNIYI